MPIYEYRCGSCGAELEKLQKISDPPLVECPECGKDALVKLISASSFRLKGSGWYETDFKTGKKKNGAGEGGSEGGGERSASTDAAATTTSTTAPESANDGSKSTGKERAGSDGGKSNGSKNNDSKGTEQKTEVTKKSDSTGVTSKPAPKA